jgi:ankyrin repeat protein
MHRKLTSRSTLENLKREAKRWLRALRAGVGTAQERLERAVPGSSATPAPTLRDVQHALAREHGFPGWSALTAGLEGDTLPERAPQEVVDRFVDNACPDHHVRGGPDHVRALHTAMRLLARYPDIPRSNFQTAVVCGEIEAVERALKKRPELARLRDAEPGPKRSGVGGSGDLFADWGPKGWEPLLSLCFTRLALPAVRENALAIARMLLDAGADPDAFFMAGDSRYTPLVGVIGEGEEDRPPHSRRDELAALLLARGANPFDQQVTYNIGFHGKVRWWLEMIHERSRQLGLEGNWRDPEWTMLDMGGYGSGARWYLEMAVRTDDRALADWCLTHGANPNAAPASARSRPKVSLYEGALRANRTQIAELLVEHGATKSTVILDALHTFVAACVRLERDVVRAMVRDHPEYLASHLAIFAAAREDRVDVAEFLLDLGVSPDIENDRKERPLHIAAYANSLRVARLLLARGADPDAVESSYQNTPLGSAVYYGHREMIELIGQHSHDIWELCYTGNLERLRVVLAGHPDRARLHTGGHTPLMWLPPHDEAVALDVARLFIALGADPTLRNNDGMTAADRAERLGMFDVAALLRAASPPAAEGSP